MATAVSHYTAYKPKPFVKEERKDVTILFGGLTWKHERLIQGVMHNLKYNAEPLPNITRPDLDAGKELIDTGACCPTIFTTGNLVNFLKTKTAEMGKEEVSKKFVYMTAGSCGPCRFGQYHESYSMALDGLGLKDFRMFLLAQDVDQSEGSGNGDGLEVNLQLSLGIVWAILCGDMLTDLEYIIRPYEVNPGQTDAVLKESAEYLYEAFRNRPIRGEKWGAVAWHFMTGYFANALREVRKKFDAIEVDHLQVRAKVKITGEFWLQTHEGEGNYNIKQWLEQEGSELIPPPVAVWLDYLMAPFSRSAEKGGSDSGAKWKQWLLEGVIKAYHGTYNRFRKALAYLPYELPDQMEIKNLAEPYFSHKLRGGEGHMLVGKALYTYHHKKAHMVCELSPYSCMPNTMSIGSMANVLGKYPDMLYAPIEIKGDAEVHALSRCQMILTEAKKRAQSEFEQVLTKTGLTLEAIRAIEARRPELKRATYKIPHLGYAGTAANYVAHLAERFPAGRA